MGTYFGSYALFLAAAISTHALVGYTLGSALYDAPRAGLLGGVVADADFLLPATLEWPLVHRGITHSAVAVGVLAAVVAARSRATGGALGAGYVSHLVIDATTPMGIPLAYPVVTERIGVSLGGHSPTATAVLWACCLGWLSCRGRLPVGRAVGE
ncbi:metal-dependent hydrolase [Halobacteriales archaeon QS_1_68_20]|nr:MAG: metal-dependent hydrolase [Halobacteriales archaeon QS_1_68_20]